jgi:hypothetical protein
MKSSPALSWGPRKLGRVGRVNCAQPRRQSHNLVYGPPARDRLAVSLLMSNGRKSPVIGEWQPVASPSGHSRPLGHCLRLGQQPSQAHPLAMMPYVRREQSMRQCRDCAKQFKCRLSRDAFETEFDGSRRMSHPAVVDS